MIQLLVTERAINCALLAFINSDFSEITVSSERMVKLFNISNI